MVLQRFSHGCSTNDSFPTKKQPHDDPFFMVKKEDKHHEICHKKHLNERRENGVPLSQVCLYLL